ncbi:MAG: hypothetical protein RI907_1707 [Pseudomonadota bacterium]
MGTKLLLCGVAASFVAPAWALDIDDEKYPFSVWGGHTVTRDTNFSRDDDAQGETIQTTSIGTELDKAYGRQKYKLSGTASVNRYAHYGSRLNNESGSLDGSFNTEFLRDWSLNVGGSYARALTPIQNNYAADARVVRNMRRNYDVNSTLRYGIDGRWAISGTLDYNVLRYSQAAYATLNADQWSAALRTNYYVTDRFFYGVGYRQVETTYPSRLIDGQAEVQNDRNIDLSVNWQATGLSNLNAMFSRRVSDYRSDDTRRVRGWNGSAGWSYTPGGMLSYGATYSRLTSADRLDNTYVNLFGSVVGQSNYASIQNVTTLQGYAAAAVTGKTSVRLSHSLTKSRMDQSNVGFSEFSMVRDSVGHNTRLSMSYAPIRSVALQCGLTAYSQTRDWRGYRFDGRTYDCTASLTLD